MRTYEDWLFCHQLDEMFYDLPPLSTGFAADLEYINQRLYESMGVPASVLQPKLFEPPFLYDVGC